MQIDWFTLIAQIINFLILVALLKRFLYGPIIRAMDQREQKIRDRLQEAEQKIQQARREAELYRQQQQELEQRREAMFSQVRADVEAERKALIQNARDEVNQIQARWQHAIRQQQDAFVQHFRQRAIQQIYAISRHALADLANTDLEQHMIEVFIERIQKLNTDERQVLRDATKSVNGGANHKFTVHSAFEIPEAARQRIDKVVREQVANDINLRFETTPNLICGIELTAPGCKLAWSLDNYLTTLDESLSTVFAQENEDRV